MAATPSRITLRAYAPVSLADPDVKRNVLAAARALCERMGVSLVELTADDGALHATLDAPAVVATGFAAELRRATEQWHSARYGAPLWRQGA